jgi:restriction system protein
MSTDTIAIVRRLLIVLLDFVPILWPFLVLIFGYYLFIIARKYWRRHRLSRMGLSEVDLLSGKDFETYLATRFRALGYKVEQTKLVGDYGADLVLTREGYRTVVQAKRYSKNVGIKAVQEVLGAKAKYKAQNAIVVTNSGYTREAVELAQSAGVELWGRERLISELLRTPGAPAESASTPQQSSVAVCSICGCAVSQKVRDYCAEHRDRFGGDVYCFEHQKTIRKPKAESS